MKNVSIDGREYRFLSFADCKALSPSVEAHKEAFLWQIATWASEEWGQAMAAGRVLDKRGRYDYFRKLLERNAHTITMLQLRVVDRSGHLQWIDLGYTAIYPEKPEVGKRHFENAFNQYELNGDAILGPLSTVVTHYYVQAVLIDIDRRYKNSGEDHLPVLKKMLCEQFRKLGLWRNPNAIVFAEIFNPGIRPILSSLGWKFTEHNHFGTLKEIGYAQGRRLAAYFDLVTHD